jgi:methane/ammonia monooxygenase subunit B
MKTIKERVAKVSFVGLLLALVTTSFYAPSAAAHGEKSQAAFMRMRTIIWYDLNWSSDSVPVNETVTIDGKFHVFAGWPETVAIPDIAFLNIGIPGPVFVRQESYIGGQIVPRSVALKLGEDYEFKVVLKARRPGDWHVHTMMNVKGGGPIIGPGKWVNITGSMSSFTNPITTLTGKTVDIETFNEGTIWAWHALWFAIGLAWMAYFCKGPVFLPRWIMVHSGRAKELITDTDKKVTIAFMLGTVLLVGFSYGAANSSYPITIPLQGGVLREIPHLPDQRGNVHVKVDDATYRVPGRAMKMTLTIHNGSETPVRLAEFQAGAIRFLDAEVFEDDTLYPENVLAPDGLTNSDNSPIAPDETRTVEVTAQDASWEIERMSDIIYDPDSRFGAIVWFIGEDGSRQSAILNAPLIPVFM